MTLRLSDFDYQLPQALIAQHPIEPRDHSRLLVAHRATGAIEHRHFYDLPSYLEPGDVLVLNETRVFPARLYGRKEHGGAQVEILLVRPLVDGGWEAMVRPSRRLAPGATVVLERSSDGVVEVAEHLPGGTRRVVLPPGLRLEDAGHVPLPPYIHEPLADPERYQTVYARASGSVAAPTAGLHFTPALLERLDAHGVRLTKVVLHVGPGTFRPVHAEDPRKHDLGQEAFQLPPEAVRAIKAARAAGKRVVCVGTTSVRTLETAARDQRLGEDGRGMEVLEAQVGWTDLFILPGFRFRRTDALVTNFHLPRSTLLMLVAAFMGKDLMDRAYAEAIKEGYRFYSFGDAMLIL